MRRTTRVRCWRVFGADQPLKLDCGIDLAPFQIAYKTYGELNAERSNAILVCHALTGDQHVANVHPVTGKPGWWETMVGPGRPLDTDRYFIICPNVIGGCMGSTGPASTNPGHRQSMGTGFSGHHHSRHGACAGHADRSPRHRDPVLRGRRLDGRHAGAAMDGGLSETGVLGAGGGVQHPALGAEHRVPRARPAGRDGRPGLASRPLFRARQPIRIAASASRGWPRISPICRTPPCTASSGGGCRTASCRRFRSTRISRSRAICATRARPLSSGSTPTAISI